MTDAVEPVIETRSLEWGDRLGADVIVRILDQIHSRTFDPRYRASLWLRRRAELKLPLAAHR